MIQPQHKLIPVSLGGHSNGFGSQIHPCLILPSSLQDRGGKCVDKIGLL